MKNPQITRLFPALFFLFINTHSFAQSIISTIAGDGTTQFSGDNGPAIAAKINFPTDVCISNAGNIYFVDAGNSRIRKIDPSGTITTIAGNGATSGASVIEDVAINTAIGEGISCLCVDASENIYFGHFASVYKISAATGLISRIAGNAGYSGYSGDNGPATAALLATTIQGICTDNYGNIFIVDKGNNRVREINGTTGIITTIAGNGIPAYAGDGGVATNASLNNPTVICINKTTGEIFIADEGNYLIRKVNVSGVISSIAGTCGSEGFWGDGGPATNALIGEIEGLCIDTRGDLYITDISCSCRKISMISGKIMIMAGDKAAEGYNGDGIPSINGLMDHPRGLCFNSATNDLIIADANNNRLRKVTQPQYALAVNETQANKGLNIFPNPSDGLISLQVTDDDINSKVEIINTAGIQVYNATIATTQTKIDIQKQPHGIYFLSVISPGNIKTQSILIKE